MDVDKWEINMSPDFYHSQFPSTLSTVKLSCHIPKRNPSAGNVVEGDLDDHQRGQQDFEDWLLLAESGHQLWVEQRFKQGFYEELKNWRTIQPADAEWQSTYGTSHVPVSVFVHCLNTSGCDTIHLKGYGQKLPLLPPFQAQEPAQLDHPLSWLNMWDIGITFSCSQIYLFSPSHGNSNKITSYPMIIPGSLDFGSLLIIMRDRGEEFKIKIYPRLVHVIKSYNSRLQGEAVTTVAGLKGRGAACQKMIDRLSKVPSSELGGYRIEVTVQAKTLEEAEAKVMDIEGIPFFDINWWMNPTGQGRERYKVEVKLVHKKALLANANWVYERAMQEGILTGNNVRKPGFVQKQGILDLLCSFGWNAGKKKMTSSLDPSAWWRGAEETEEGTRPGGVSQKQLVLAHIRRKYQSKADIKQLWNLLKARGEKKCVPCLKVTARAADKAKHKYQLCDWKPFKIRCGVRPCGHTMDEAEAFDYFAEIISGQEALLAAVEYID
ncbi:hypothetical protein I317_05295 [Kwoniella heveanensis CBS 569]|nr:hypothetical protein I317_05295 [Kwoniella heveanensis CBS 569]